MKRIITFGCTFALFTGLSLAQTPVPPPDSPTQAPTTPGTPGTPPNGPSTYPPPSRPLPDNRGIQPGATNTNSTVNPEGKGAPGSGGQRSTGAVTNAPRAATNNIINRAPSP